MNIWQPSKATRAMTSNWTVTITQYNEANELETITSPFIDEQAATAAALQWETFEDVETVVVKNPDGEEVELS